MCSGALDDPETIPVRRDACIIFLVIRTNLNDSAGAAYDLKNAMLYIGNKFPDAPIYGIGFSLGAGMLTKYLCQCYYIASVKAAVLTYCISRCSCRGGSHSREDWYCPRLSVGSFAVS